MEKRKVGSENGYSATSTPTQTKLFKPSIVTPNTLTSSLTSSLALSSSVTSTSIISSSSSSSSMIPSSSSSSSSEISQTPNKFNKVFNDYGVILQRRKNELEELKKSNQNRSHNDDGNTQQKDPNIEHRLVTTQEILKSDNLTPTRSRISNYPSTPTSTFASTVVNKSRARLSKDNHEDISFTNPKVLGKTNSHEISSASVLTPLKENGYDIPDVEPLSPYSPEKNTSKKKDDSMYSDLVDQLLAEKLRVTDLTSKISELLSLEEEQRSKVKEISIERDSLKTFRDKLLAEITLKTSLFDEQSRQIALKDNRIRDLEATIAGYLLKESDLHEKYDQFNSKMIAVESERDSFRSQLHNAFENQKELYLEIQSYKEKNDELQLCITDLETERDDLMYESSSAKLGVIKLTKENELKDEQLNAYSIERKELLEKIEELTQSELSLSNLIETREREFRELSRHNELLMKKYDLLEDRGYRAEKILEQLQSKNETLEAEFSEMSKNNIILRQKDKELTKNLSEITLNTQQELNYAHEIVNKKTEEFEIIQNKLTEFHSYITSVVTERDKLLQSQKALQLANDSIKLDYRKLEVSIRGKTSFLLMIIWILVLGFIYQLFLDSNLYSSCLARYS